MIGTHTTLSRLFRGIAVAASLVALTAPAALADPPNRAHDPWFNYATSTSDATGFVTDTLAGPRYGAHDPWFNYATTSDASGFVTDTLAPGGGTTETPGYRFISDTLAPGGGLVMAGPVAHGFDWTDAVIGAASTAGLMLILLGGARLLSHRRSVLAV